MWTSKTFFSGIMPCPEHGLQMSSGGTVLPDPLQRLQACCTCCIMPGPKGRNCTCNRRSTAPPQHTARGRHIWLIARILHVTVCVDDHRHDQASSMSQLDMLAQNCMHLTVTNRQGVVHTRHTVLQRPVQDSALQRLDDIPAARCQNQGCKQSEDCCSVLRAIRSAHRSRHVSKRILI